MLGVLLSWIYILFISYSLGLGFYKIWSNWEAKDRWTWEMYILSGLVIATIYAQIVSLFVGLEKATVNIVLIIVSVIACIYAWDTKPFKINIVKSLNSYLRAVNFIFCLKIMCGVVIVLCFGFWTVQVPQHYDTYLYHAQAIHWIEKYGVVAGLGNLHNRFAYNSAFLVVQALFSLKALGGVSFHTLNGFISVVFIVYALTTFKGVSTKRLYISDGMRVALGLFLFHYISYTSSPNTDTFVLALVTYIFTKWCENIENGETSIDAYGYLGLLIIYACTLKLSAGFIVVLLIKPICQLLNNRKWRKLLGYVILSCMIVLPFVLRNIIISGYVLYPYASLDIIPFIDWKMDPAILEYDKKEIIVWGRTTYNVADTYGWSIVKWFPLWFGNLNTLEKANFIGGAISSLGIVITAIYWIIYKRFDELLIGIASVVGFGGWLFTAPLIRYGEIYMQLSICIFVLFWMKNSRLLKKIGRLCCSVGMCCIILLIIIRTIRVMPEADWLALRDYENKECIANEWNDLVIYIPLTGDQTGYEPFPAVPNIPGEITLRGSSWKDGFKLK